MKTLKRILLADDHTFVCNLLRDLLEPEYEVVGCVSDGRELLEAADSLRPDVVLVDIGMPLPNGLGTTIETDKSHIETDLSNDE